MHGCVCYSSYFCSPSAEKDTVLRSREGEKGVEDVEQLSRRCRIREEVLEMQQTRPITEEIKQTWLSEQQVATKTRS